MSEKRRDSKNRILRNGESANAKMDAMRLNILIQQESSNLFIAGNWNEQTSYHRGKETTFHLEKRKR